MHGADSPGVELSPGSSQPKPCWEATVPSPRVPRQTPTPGKSHQALYSRGGAHRATTHSVPGYLGGLSSNFFCTS